MMRVVFLAALVFIAPRFLAAQDIEEIPTAGADDFIPVFLLYHTALSGNISWRPDWPLFVPPDAFSIPGEGASALTLGFDPASAETGEELSVRRKGGGLLAGFPLFKNSVLFRVQTLFTEERLIRAFTVTREGDVPPDYGLIDVLIVEYEENFPSLIRVVHGETLYFVMIEYAIAQATEIWYDEDGKALAVFSFQCETPGGRIRRVTSTDLVSGEENAEVYHYDSMGNISGIVSAAGEYSALYTGKGKPRYWERLAAVPDPGHFSFQWDEEGRVTRFTGVYRSMPLPDAPDGVGETDVRYDYTLDARGNWTERRAVSMARRAGFLVSGPVERIYRRIEYPAF
jgi:hypothetical protein